jgi:hypothetical protein
MGPPGPGSSQYGSRYSMSRTYGPRDIISLVIPRLGDNNKLILAMRLPILATLRHLPVLYNEGFSSLLRVDFSQ